MGYTTDFNGSLSINPPLSPERVEYINRFSGTRRMKRDVAKLKELYGGEYGLNGEYGVDGEFFARDDGSYGQKQDDSIINYNGSPSTQPGLWCQWVISDEGDTLEWDGGEKFYYYTEWLEYIIKNFIEPTGSKCNGTIEWQGEESSDMGRIVVKNNKVKEQKAKVVYDDEEGDDEKEEIVLDFGEVVSSIADCLSSASVHEVLDVAKSLGMNIEYKGDSLFIRKD